MADTRGGSVGISALQPLNEKSNETTGLVVTPTLTPDAEVSHTAHQCIRPDVGAHLPRLARRPKQVRANRDESINEFPVQPGECPFVTVERPGETMLRDQKIDEEINPLGERRVRRLPSTQELGSRRGTEVDLMPIHRNDEFGSTRKVAIDRRDAHPRLPSDLSDGRVDSRGDEHLGSGGEKRPLIALRIRSWRASHSV